MELALLGVVAVLVIVAVAGVAPRIGVAAPVILVLLGTISGYLPGVEPVVVDPEIVLMVVLPPILYAAAVNVPLMDFRRNFRAITGLSVVLVVLSAVVVGLVLRLLLPDLSFAAAIALGAVVAPPDAVAATAVGKKLGLPHRLVTVLEGEGLVNDATALVLLRSAVAATAATAASVEVADVAVDFVRAVAIALVIGAAVGLAAVFVRGRMSDPVLSTAISFAVPFVAFIPAEHLHASGVLAVVVAGLLTGHLAPKHLSPADRISERTNWRTAQMLLENGVFLLVGLELHGIVDQVADDDLSVDQAVAIGVLVAAVLTVVRAGFVVPLVASLRRERRRAVVRAAHLDSVLSRIEEARTVLPPEILEDPRFRERGRRVTRKIRRRRADLGSLQADGLGWRGGAVLAWSGMRGVVTVAAAQTLPADLPYRPQLVLIALTVAIVTLVVQGGTLPWVIRIVGVQGTDEDVEREQLATLVGEITSAGVACLENPSLRRSDGSEFPPETLEGVRDAIRRTASLLTVHGAEDGQGPASDHHALRRRAIEAERAALADARTSGAHPSHVVDHVEHLLDLEEARLDLA